MMVIIQILETLMTMGDQKEAEKGAKTCEQYRELYSNGIWNVLLVLAGI